MKKAKSKNRNFYRIAAQGLIVLLLAYMLVRLFVDKSYVADFEAYCPYGGMMAYSSFIVNNTLACSMTSLQIAMGFALLIVVILFSKLFCSYICPIGTFTEWLGRLGEKYKVRYTIKGLPDQLLRVLKYGLLFTIMYFTITSSELFCKKLDPFYAVFTGFSGDVNVIYALITLAVVILGSFFVRQFWCKYLCPLGAATNIFAFTIYFAVITAVFFLFELAFKPGLNWMWYIGIICFTGFILEALKVHTFIFPFLKVTRHQDVCTNCKICDKVCPYKLDVSTVDTVTHIDCHLCGDCIARCPEKGALKYNGRNMKWLPVLAIVVLTSMGIIYSKYYEVPTIDIKWGTPEQMSKASSFEMGGLKSIKCYGSSMSFATHIEGVPGILGVQTYVKSFHVKIFYDPTLINEEGIKKLIFSPVKELFYLPGDGTSEIGIFKTGINNFFDSKDETLLIKYLRQEKGIFAFETQYGEPVQAKFYYDNALISSEKIIQLIENKSITIGEGEESVTTEADFKVVSLNSNEPLKIQTTDFIAGLYTPYSKTFNDFETLDSTKLLIYEIQFPQCLFPEFKGSIPYLRNHMMGDKGIVKFETALVGTKAFIRLYYVKGKTTEEAIFLSLNKEKLSLTYKNGEKGEEENPFRFAEKGQTIN